METYTDEVALLVAQTGELNGQRWALRDTITIGRDPTCDIVILDRQVSRFHTRLTLTHEGIILEDLGSKNGTYYNGKPLETSALLQDSDTIQIAFTQEFIFLSSDSTVPLNGPLSDDHFDVPSTKQNQTRYRLTLDKRSRSVFIYIDGKEGYQKREIVPPLSVSQFRLLEILFENQGNVVPRSELTAAVWGKEQAYEVSEQALDALVRRLRDRISNIDPDHDYIVTVRGHGLRLENPEINI